MTGVHVQPATHLRSVRLQYGHRTQKDAIGETGIYVIDFFNNCFTRGRHRHPCTFAPPEDSMCRHP